MSCLWMVRGANSKAVIVLAQLSNGIHVVMAMRPGVSFLQQTKGALQLLSVLHTGPSQLACTIAICSLTSMFV